MKTLSAEAAAAIESGEFVMAGAVRFSFSTVRRFWSGYGPLTIAGQGEFIGVGARALIVPVAEELGGGAGGVELVLSKLDADVAASINDEDYNQKPAVIWRLFYDSAGINLLHAHVFARGRVDEIPIEGKVNGPSALRIKIEGPGIDLSRSGARTHSDSDQRLLGGALDGSMRHVSTAPRKTLYWGNRP